ncbi:HAD-IIA family hydrolase [Actinomycetospora termitidis]|uniref:HAD-IIA family hydrolase n=1 Tax=Actinomycetospora termitidis TaxID=3053470 RepID=A0ABT7MCI9_9PSEU|nr:HAD-IIA family hydrolase [Actinomycetospora sp. Odt1-22]MDL5158389.1 HAD-IIA family hydrolase [Actinomycetospora sp. Odt1-22]
MTGHRHDALLVDLDGTVYAGPAAIPGAVEALEAARGRGLTVSYVTNNASRAPGAVSEHLAELGLTVTEEDVVTSAQAGAAVLAGQVEPGAPVLVLGTEALADEIRGVGLTPVRADDDGPVAVVQGHSPDTGWRQLAEAALTLARGAVWVACNVDPTLPSERGLLPGNGSMVAALRHASRREPQVAGKPATPLLRQAMERVGSTTPLVVGDRLDTDIAGGNAVGAESLLVLTGVSTAADLLAAPSDQRPTYVAADLVALADVEAVRVGADDGWTAKVHDDGSLELAASAAGDDDREDRVAALRALCTAHWEAVGDEGGAPAVRGGDDAARRVLSSLGLGADR